MKIHYLFIFLISILIGLVISCNDSPTTVNDNEPSENTDNNEPGNDDEKEWQLVWSDEFDSDQLNMDKWSFQYGTGADEGLQGWGNNELQYYTDREENVFIQDGNLHIVAQKESYEGMRYTSGRIRTIGKGDWVYGKIEIRAKLPEGQGIWPALWMLPSKENFVWPTDGEIDIAELVGHEPAIVHGTVHFGDKWPENDNDGATYSLSDEIFADNFHTFLIEWKLNEILFFVDDNHFFTVTPSTVKQYHYPFNATFHLLMNVAVGGDWPKSPDSSTQFPQSMIIDYVRVYQLQ